MASCDSTMGKREPMLLQTIIGEKTNHLHQHQVAVVVLLLRDQLVLVLPRVKQPSLILVHIWMLPHTEVCLRAD
jgi:hypothetical protein